MRTQISNPVEAARQYAEAVWNQKNLHAIDQMVLDNVVIHSSLGEFSGKAAMKQVVEAWLLAFPDIQVREEQAITEGELVSVQWRAEGTHQGTFKGILPTGTRVSYKGTTVYRFKNGQIVEYWAYLDMQQLINQLT